MAQQIIEGTGEELIRLLNQQPQDRFRLVQLPTDQEFHSFEKAFAQASMTTSEEVAGARDRLILASPPPRELPEGKTIEDVVMGKWPGDETDGQIFEALRKLS